MTTKPLGYIIIVPPSSHVFVVPRLSVRAKRTICQVLCFVSGLLTNYFIAGVVKGVLPVFGGLTLWVVCLGVFILSGLKGGCFR
jgi:hypothetical protein